jgi:hypothetical protein
MLLGPGSWSILAAIALAGCAAPPPGPVDPVSIRPAATIGPTRPAPPSGVLRVRTEAVESLRGDDVARRLHEGYDLFDASGEFVRHVKNHLSLSDESPTSIHLPPGGYRVAIPDARRPRLWIAV